MTVIGIGAGMNQAKAAAWRAQFGLTYLILADPGGATYGLFGNGYVPFNAVIGGQMTLLWSNSGYEPTVMISTIEAELPNILWISHTPLPDTEDTASPMTVAAEITSGFAITGAEVHYRVDGAAWQAVAMTLSGRDAYSAAIPAQPLDTTVDYYLDAVDSVPRTRVVPRGAPDVFYTFYVGVDAVPPSIEHTPRGDLPQVAFPVAIRAVCTDNIGIDHVTLDYELGGPCTQVPMTHLGDGIYEGLMSGSPPVGQLVQYRIIAVDSSQASNQTVIPPTGHFTFTVVDQEPVFIWELDGRNTSRAALEAACDELAVEHEAAAAPPNELLVFKSVFVLLGTANKQPHVLTAAEGELLADYLDRGGNLYMEGGETWFYDPPTAAHPYFKIHSTSDGATGADLGPVTGGPGSFVEGMAFEYNGDNAWMDHLEPEAGSTASVLWHNARVGSEYDCGIAYDAGSYRTIGTSFEFYGLVDLELNTRTEVMRRYLDFFGVSEPPATPTPAPSPTPAYNLGVRIEMPLLVHPGEPFQVVGFLDNPGAPLADVPTFFILEVYGEYWFWPNWKHYAPPESTEIDYQNTDLDTGTLEVQVIAQFTWPDTGNDSVTGLHFYGALLDDTMTAIRGDMAIVEWGFGPN